MRGRNWAGRVVRCVAVGVLCMAILGPARAGGAHDRPLPETNAFLSEVRKRLKSDDRLLSEYTFRERQVRIDFNGRTEKKTTREYEMYPSAEGSPSYRRLVATNGVPEPARKLEDADRQHREKLLAVPGRLCLGGAAPPNDANAV